MSCVFIVLFLTLLGSNVQGNLLFIYEITGEEITEEKGVTTVVYNWERHEIYLYEDTKEELAFALFTYFFETVTYAMPEGVRVLDVTLDNGHLILNVSEDIMQYGGNTNEHALIAQMIRAALSLIGVEKLTLLIEGELRYLPEGRIIESHAIVISHKNI